MNHKPIFSIVSPIYRAENIIETLVGEIQLAMDKLQLSYEIVLVDDRSPDDSWNKMRQLAQTNDNLKAVRLSKNFGQHAAIIAGISIAKGEWVVVMDCDLQDQPKEIERLYNKALEGYEIVLARRGNRKDGFLKRLSSDIFSQIYSYFTDSRYDNEVGNYGIYHRKVIDSILDIKDYIKAFPLFVRFVGFNLTTIDAEHAARLEGKSSYNLSKLLSLAFNTIISFSNKPLKLFVKLGLAISALSFFAGLYTIYLYFNDRIQVAGYSSIILSIWFLSGILISTIGVVGIYCGKIFDQSKERPVFIVDKILNKDKI